MQRGSHSIFILMLSSLFGQQLHRQSLCVRSRDVCASSVNRREAKVRTRSAEYRAMAISGNGRCVASTRQVITKRVYGSREAQIKILLRSSLRFKQARHRSQCLDTATFFSMLLGALRL